MFDFKTNARALKTLSLVGVLLSTSVLFAKDPSENGRIAFFADMSGTRQIYTINPDGTDLFQVTNLPPSENVFALWPDFSPDGTRIVFSHDMTGAFELYVINADGMGLTQITHDGRDHGLPHWSPDGAHIVFNTAGPLGLGAIATVRADGTDTKLLSSRVWDSFGAQYTGDGRHIVFSTQTGGYVATLWIMDTDGKNQRRLTAPALRASPPDVSTEGKQRVVFYNHHNTPFNTSSIFIMNLDGTRLTRLTSAKHVNTLPVFSPDGKKVLFMSDRLSPGSFDTYVMNVDGTNRKRILKDVEALAPNWGTRVKP